MVCSVVTGAASCFSDVFCSMHAADSMHKRLESSSADAAKTTMPVLSIQIQASNCAQVDEVNWCKCRQAYT